MNRNQYTLFDEVLPDGDAMLRLAERFGEYGMYHEESIDDDFGEGLAQRHDALLNFLETGGRFGRAESLQSLAVRTNYFRETYAYGHPVADGIEAILHHPGFTDAARATFDRPIVEPAIVYANFLIPGQELAVHTDVPEFRGINRTKDPQWLIVAMHHSGLFDRWRMPIATAVCWFGDPQGGDFVFYPDGADQPPITRPARHNTSLLIDTDSVFHGVDRVSEARTGMAPLEADMKLRFDADGMWYVGRPDEIVAAYTWSDLRFSISWKAYCFADAAERDRVTDHADDLTREQVFETLISDLRERGRVGDDLPADNDLALTIIDEYIHYPPPTPMAQAI